MRRVIIPALAILILAGCNGSVTQVRMESAESKIGEVTSSQEQLSLGMDELAKELLALKERVATLEKMGGEPPVAVASGETKVADIEPPTQSKAVKEKAPSAPVIPKEGALPEPVKLTKAVDAGQDKEAPTAKETVKSDKAQSLYAKAFGAYKKGRFAKSILDFEDFILFYPDHDYADDARYFIGESYFSQGEYEQAIAEFNRLAERYAHKARAADAWYMIGESYEKLGEAERSKALYTRVVEQYPGSEAAHRAQKKLQAP